MFFLTASLPNSGVTYTKKSTLLLTASSTMSGRLVTNTMSNPLLPQSDRAQRASSLSTDALPISRSRAMASAPSKNRIACPSRSLTQCSTCLRALLASSGP